MQTASNEKLFQLRDVTKSFGNVVAIQGVTFEVGMGEIVGLVGDNGAEIDAREGHERVLSAGQGRNPF